VGALTTYQTQVSRLLHDPLFQFWSQTELADYINEARNRVAQDSLCLRQLVGQSTGPDILLTIGQDFYTPQTLLGAIGPNLVQVLGITIWWGTFRIKLSYYPYTQFDANFRRYSTYQGRPVAFTRMGANNVVIGPPPDQAYSTDWDISVIPNPLVSDSSVETMPVPFQEPVQYYAAYKAKWKEQAQGEALLFQKQYIQVLQWCLRGFASRTIPNPYRIGM
jgi:hypothetical protein